MDVISAIVAAFFKAFSLMGGLLMSAVDNIAAGLRAPLVHEGLPPDAALALIAMIPVLCFIAAWRVFAGYKRMGACVFLAASFTRIAVPAVMMYVRSYG